jgi:hypothetical protein
MQRSASWPEFKCIFAVVALYCMLNVMNVCHGTVASGHHKPFFGHRLVEASLAVGLSVGARTEGSHDDHDSVLIKTKEDRATDHRQQELWISLLLFFAHFSVKRKHYNISN